MTTDNAQEACREISSQAENIKAKGNAAGGMLGFLNPQNWKTTNEAKETIKNILGVDMSTESITDIQNMCNNTFGGVQSNVIDTSQCEYCQKNKCTVSGNRQTNKIKNMQTCGANAIIDKLREKSGDIASQAAIKAIQDAQGLMAGNKSDVDMCNYTNIDMSSKDYLNALSSCSNVGSSTQENILSGCGDFIDNIQSNEYDIYQECVAGATMTDKARADLKAKIESTGEVEQKSTGLSFDLFGDMGNSIYYISGACLSSSCSILCIVILVVVGFVMLKVM